MSEVLVFAGTVEGRMITEFLSENGIKVHACVATAYGKELLPEEGELVSVSDKRLDEAGMEELIKAEDPDLIIDATHPYAAEVTDNAASAAMACGKEYIRLVREESKVSEGDIIYADSVSDAVSKLEKTSGNILAATGSKELKEYTKLPNYKERVYARVLSLPEVAESCAALGFEGKHLICMQGPFSKELNAALLRQFDCKYMVSKESGSAGGFMEKYEACKECGTVLVVIGRPLKEAGLSYMELKRKLILRFGLKPRQKITLAGIGMGNVSDMTREVYDAVRGCDLLIGAQRMVECAGPSQAVYVEYRADKIALYIKDHPEYENITIALSGDVGFYSGAKRLLKELPEGAEILPGISSMVYFMSKIGMSWEDVVPVSLHGRDMNIISMIRDNEKVFAIVGNSEGIGEICEKLVYYGLGDTTVYIGERLSYVNESINCASANAFSLCTTDPLSVALFVRRDFKAPSPSSGIPDEEFIRGKVPMTKEEIREICLSKLRLKKDSTVYDVGAGTGAVSVEMALKASLGTVYSVEKNPEAVKLIKKNRQKFICDNIDIIEGTAPDALTDLPSPTHAFIGGSSGNLREILNVILLKNPFSRVVVTCITLETLSETLECLKTLHAEEPDIVQISAARSKSVGRYHLMTGQNPVYIVSWGRGEKWRH